MNVVKINLRNVIFVMMAMLVNNIKEVDMGYESMVSYASANVTPATSNRKHNMYDMCPVGKECSKLSVECLNCDLTTNCVYGATYTTNCTVPDQVDCLGEKVITKQYICRYCYQTDHWEHKCHLKNSCINSDIICLGKRKFMKNLRCNWTAGYRWSTALILSITLGGFGADRFYLGHWQEGIGKLFSFGGLGVWTLIDVMLISMRYLGPADGSLYI
ncbi:hypothetical protein HCN44_008444 [Aphidius gifuensis]|uniref:TM2 domain-containing protein n=1 Tax=Aphidius gifuensis TaxID=684658 RepID=A0A834XQJ7_APHGI|nr:hypothetical protein HCN44_008444 [Aphidius gifuensis]